MKYLHMETYKNSSVRVNLNERTGTFTVQIWHGKKPVCFSESYETLERAIKRAKTLKEAALVSWDSIKV